MSSLYIHVATEKDDLVTVTVSFIANEAVADLMRRAAAACRAQLPSSAAHLLASGGYDLRLLDDANPPEKATARLTACPDGGDVFATAALPVAVYVNAMDVAGIADTVALVPNVRNGVTTPRELIAAFCAAANVPLAQGLEALRLSLDGIVALPVAASSDTVAWLTEQQDVFVVRRAPTRPPTATAPPPKPPSAAVAPKAAAATAIVDSVRHEALKVMKKARELKDKKQLASACSLLRDLVAGLEDEPRMTDILLDALVAIGEMQAAARLPGTAAETFARAAALPAAPADKVLLAQKLRGTALHDATQYTAAMGVFNTCLETLGSLPSAAPAALVVEVKIRLGAAMFMAGLDQGIAVVQESLAGDISNDLGILWMTRFYLKLNHHQEALTWAVQLLVKHTNDPEGCDVYKANLANIIGAIPDAMDILKKILGGEQSADKREAIWGFFAIVCKDFGQVRRAEAIYTQLVPALPLRPGVALDHAHLLETCGRPLEGLRLAKAYLAAQTQVVGGVDCRAVAALIGPLEGMDGQSPVAASTIAQRLSAPRQNIRLLQGDTLQLYDAAAADGAEASPLPAPRHSDSTGAEQVRQEFAQPQLELLGLMFASVKVLFLLGVLDRCLPLLAMVNPPKARNAIHRTIMRNEAAYFSQIGHLLQHHDVGPERPLLAATYDDVLYVVGDSHVLSAAWKVVTVQGRRTMFVPALVTGLKIWHLRDEGVFYPKHGFEAVTSSIPSGASVMFIMGEIDCREGVLPSVEKGIYPSTEAAMAYLATLYVSVLRRMRRKFSRVFMHMPPAVLDLTRQLVLALQTALAAAVAPHSAEICLLDPVVLNAIKTAVLDEFQLDSTHLSPAYVQRALEPCINEALTKMPATGQ